MMTQAFVRAGAAQISRNAYLGKHDQRHRAGKTFLRVEIDRGLLMDVNDRLRGIEKKQNFSNRGALEKMPFRDSDNTFKFLRCGVDGECRMRRAGLEGNLQARHWSANLWEVR
jgi:hypothetical protein